MMRTKAFDADYRAAEMDGTFEAIVSVFGNVDKGGDEVQPGAFSRTLAEWKASGDPIPVIFAHRWDDLSAHLGVVVDAEERPDGLWVKGQLDLDDPVAAKVHRLMRRRSLRAFSFAYDVQEERMEDGVKHLIDLTLFEVGPCLIGLNPDTELLTVKAAGDVVAVDVNDVPPPAAELSTHGWSTESTRSLIAIAEASARLTTEEGQRA